MTSPPSGAGTHALPSRGGLDGHWPPWTYPADPPTTPAPESVIGGWADDPQARPADATVRKSASLVSFIGRTAG